MDLGRRTLGRFSSRREKTTIAQGEAQRNPGNAECKWTASRRAAGTQPQHVTRIVLDPILLQERDEFSLKIVFLVMLRLTGDVGEGGSDLSGSDREGAVSLLPLKPIDCTGLVHPTARTRLLISRIAFASGRDDGRDKQDVDVILRTADYKGSHAMLSGDPSDVFPEPRLYIRRNGSAPVLRGEDAVK